MTFRVLNSWVDFCAHLRRSKSPLLCSKCNEFLFTREIILSSGCVGNCLFVVCVSKCRYSGGGTTLGSHFWDVEGCYLTLQSKTLTTVHKEKHLIPFDKLYNQGNRTNNKKKICSWLFQSYHTTYGQLTIYNLNVVFNISNWIEEYSDPKNPFNNNISMVV